MILFRVAASLAAAVLALPAQAPTITGAQTTAPVQTSVNWTGYVATNAYYTGVSALIQTPVASSVQRPGPAAMASWVGIGGNTSEDLIQAGVEVDTSGPVDSYAAWYEMLPGSPRRTALEVGPGDWVHFDIHEVAHNMWQITIVNGEHVFQIQVPYASSHTSAEWIVEAPSTAFGLLPLAAVTDANFGKMSAIANGQGTRAEALSPLLAVLVGGRGQVRIVPSMLGADGASFGITTTE
jgi:hypothetical protein